MPTQVTTVMHAITQPSRLMFVQKKSLVPDILQRFEFEEFPDVTFVELKDPEFIECPNRLCRSTTNVSFNRLCGGRIVFALPPGYEKHDSKNAAKQLLDERLVRLKDTLSCPGERLVLFTNYERSVERLRRNGFLACNNFYFAGLLALEKQAAREAYERDISLYHDMDFSSDLFYKPVIMDHGYISCVEFKDESFLTDESKFDRNKLGDEFKEFSNTLSNVVIFFMPRNPYEALLARARKALISELSTLNKRLSDDKNKLYVYTDDLQMQLNLINRGISTIESIDSGFLEDLDFQYKTDD